MKEGLFDFKADVVDGVTILRVEDHASRVVAEGRGASIAAAREDAIKNAKNGDARQHLIDIAMFPPAPFD